MLTDREVERWLREDVGHRDVTNRVPGETTGRLVGRESGVVAGVDAAVRVFDYLDCDATPLVETGERFDVGETILEVTGTATDILRGERVAVNVVGHAAGIATRTARAVSAARAVSDDVAIAGTRKTTPGLRGVEKRAIAAGGGDTHRLTLSGMVMLKDNHIEEMGLVGAIEHFRELASFATKIEVEVERPVDGERAAEVGADIVLFDNCSPEEVRRGVERLPDGVLVEASGDIEIDTVPEYADTGVDVISMGSLTHSAPSLNFSFRTG
ncbi:carboxylating nicotinate-nucleotide diphosphorylase [Haladaptatus pallidirubidus]|uniref:Nicotinate-nucleotide pyrophosphorylase [carboxylating] n=1 Tax=Haladaptatus pallidirubidus TaxID=1008152 RepID=A0AAV3UF41_9EURY|nr:carboxylating nicotinate-nucleotide diphosphorylase [Haladaptatus pallidirubidus]